MTILSAIIKKEINSYFKNYTAYIVSAVYLLLSFAAMFYGAYFFEYDNRGLISFFAYQPEILNILLPALTMKMWAEEQKQGTLEFLLTQPVSRWTFVWGKYTASVIFGGFLLALTTPFVFYCSFLTNMDWLNIICGYLGCFLIMGSLCALGCLLSACHTNNILAYLTTVFAGWFWENANFDILLFPFGGLFPLLKNRLLSGLDFAPHYRAFINGQLNLTSVIYFLSIIFMCLWLNLILTHRRR